MTREELIEGWPEKKDIPETGGITMSKSSPVYKLGYNDAIEVCLTVHLAREQKLLEKIRESTNEDVIQKFIEDTKQSCPVCCGSGLLYADGKAHYHNENAKTINCSNCGGIGTTVNLDNLSKFLHQHLEDVLK